MTKDKEKKRRPGHLTPRAVSKRYIENRKRIDATKKYTLSEAVTLLKDLKNAKFDETVEICLKLGVDPRKSDQIVRGSFSLPKGIGKKVKIIVFAEGEIAQNALNAGADVVGAEDLVEKILKENWLDFDIAIAHSSAMRFVGKLGKVLGPKGMMPSPRSGTVTDNVTQAVIEFKAGKIEYRIDNGSNVHAPIGKKSFTIQELTKNIDAFIEHIKSVKPTASKGTYLQKIVISSTMGCGIPIEVKKT
jgi:large subunit ribosomal protein L1